MLRMPPLVLAALAGCASYDMGLQASDRDNAGSDNDTTSPSDGDGGEQPPPEAENDFLALRPAETVKYVFVANPARDTVTRVEVATKAVRTVEVGADPRIVKATPDGELAVVFNRGDDTVSLLGAEDLDVRVVPIRKNMNALAISPDGHWAALWHDRTAERPDDPDPQGIEAFDEVSFIEIPTGTHYPMAVDYDPRGVLFTPEVNLAAVVCATSLGMVDLDTLPLVPRIVPITDQLVDPPTAEEVVMAPDGSYAFVRQFGAEELLVVDLSTEQVTGLPAGIDPTDLDLTPDGRHAVLVSRGSAEVRVFEVAAPFDPPAVLGLPPEVSLGSVVIAPTGRLAILFTTATPTSRYATWNLDTDEITLRQLVKPVAAMAITPTGTSLLVVHTHEDGPEVDPNFIGAWALTLVDLADPRRANPLRLPGEPIGWSNSANGRFGYFIMEQQPLLGILDYTTLLPWEVDLKSAPVYVGVLPDNDETDSLEPPAWVSQEHDLGRMSFYDPGDGSLETITGFELNSEVE